MKDSVRLAPVGLGRWARVLARGAQRSPMIELVSCYSRDEKKRKAFQAEFGIGRAAETYADLLADPEVEGVVIPFIGLDDLIAICKSNEMCNYLAMDTVSLGSTLAWAMECFEKGLLTLDDTDGIPLEFHDADGVIKLSLGKKRHVLLKPV